MLVWIAHPFSPAFAWGYCPGDSPSFSVKDAWKLLFHSRNSFYRAKLVNVRDSTLMCFTAPVGPADRPRFFSLYWIPQICKHNWSESFNTREGTWPSLGFYKRCIQKNTGMSSFVSGLSAVTASTLAHIRSFHSFPFFSFLLLVRKGNIFHSSVQQTTNMADCPLCNTFMRLFFIE